MLDHDYGVVGTMPVGCSRCDVWDMALLSDGSAAMNFPTHEGHRPHPWRGRKAAALDGRESPV